MQSVCSVAGHLQQVEHHVELSDISHQEPSLSTRSQQQDQLRRLLDSTISLVSQAKCKHDRSCIEC